MNNQWDFTWREVGDRIRDWRQAAQITQRQLAEKAGLTQPGVLGIEKGAINPQLTTLQRIASAMGRSVRELLTGSPQAVSEEIETRVRRVLNSNDEAAIAAFSSGLATAEMLLARRGRTLTSPLDAHTQSQLVPTLTPKHAKAVRIGSRRGEVGGRSALKQLGELESAIRTLTPVTTPRKREQSSGAAFRDSSTIKGSRGQQGRD